MSAGMSIAATAIQIERAAVVFEARSWLGTPFHHAARIKHVGVDCAQLLLGVFVGLYLIREPTVDGYPTDWFLHQDRSRLVEIIEAHCRLTDQPRPGDIALFQYGRSASHAAIVVETVASLTAVHSFRALGVVEEEIGPGTALGSRLAGYWTLTRWVA